MSTHTHTVHKQLAKKACARCSTHKRKCDRALPQCSLCMRQRQICKYKSQSSPQPAAASSSTSDQHHLDPLPDFGAATPVWAKAAALRRLQDFKPEVVFATYSHTLQPWFPIIWESRLSMQHQNAWEDTGLDEILLFLAVVLFSFRPSLTSDDGTDPLNLMSLYMAIKGWIACTEGFGLNSIGLVQARLLISLFEVAHGLYPAAYISIGATVRAADALVVHGQTKNCSSKPIGQDEDKQERIMLWHGILIVDRFIAIENGGLPPITRGRTFSDLSLAGCRLAIPQPLPPSLAFSRALEASTLLDKVHITLNEPTAEQSFNLEAVLLIVQTLSSFKLILHQEVLKSSMLLACDWVFCNIGLITCLEDGSKASFTNDEAKECYARAVVQLDALIEDIVKMAQLSMQVSSVHQSDLPSPFSIFLIYKAAAIVTERLRRGDDSPRSIYILRDLRRFLKIIGEQWLAGNRYLELLNEDTTPRILKAMEKGGDKYQSGITKYSKLQIPISK